MAKKLSTTVVVYDDEGVRHEFTPDSEVPTWAEKVITNLKAWATDDDADSADENQESEESAEKAEQTPSSRRSARRSRG